MLGQLIHSSKTTERSNTITVETNGGQHFVVEVEEADGYTKREKVTLW